MPYNTFDAEAFQNDAFQIVEDEIVDIVDGNITPSTDLSYLDSYAPDGTYLNIAPEIINAIERGEEWYLGVELFTPFYDDIHSNPQDASYRFCTSHIVWNTTLPDNSSGSLEYKPKIKGVPELSRFIGKTFNTLTLQVGNVERGQDSASTMVLKQIIRGFRIAVRFICPQLPVERSEFIWWGRVDKIGELKDDVLPITCSQEIGNFSYELASKKFGQACPLIFGKGECLGDELFTDKSLAYQQAFLRDGQGGCNRTSARCIQLANEAFLQALIPVTVTDFFNRIDIVKKRFLFWSWKKKVSTPVQWSSKNISDNDNAVLPMAWGRVRLDGIPFVWADIGTSIRALVAFCQGEVEGFYNITCHNPNLTIANFIPHRGEFGGRGSQQIPSYFPQSGYNSRMAYGEVEYTGSEPTDAPEDSPVTSAVIKSKIISVPDNNLNFSRQYSNNPVWVAIDAITSFPYSIVRPEWFNHKKNLETANYCFKIVEDDTNADIAVISESNYQDYLLNRWARYGASGRINQNYFRQYENPNLEASSLAIISETNLLSPYDIDLPVDIDWFPIDTFGVGIQRTYLALQFTCNGVIRDTSKLSDVLNGLIFPTFRGFMRFNNRGTIDIDCRRPANNGYLRMDTEIGVKEIPVQNVSKFLDNRYYILIGAGQKQSEVRKTRGIRYVNTQQNTVVSFQADNMSVSFDDSFIANGDSPAYINLVFNGQAINGEKIELKFSEPDGTEFVWDYFVDETADMDVIAQIFTSRLNASPVFEENWTAETLGNRIIIRSQSGYLLLDRALKYKHYQGDECIQVVEVYENNREDENLDGEKDNIKDFSISPPSENYQGAKATYIAAARDFAETELIPRIVWDSVEAERNLKLMELDLRFVDNYRQAAWLLKSGTIDYIDGAFYPTFTTSARAMFHQEGDVIAVRHQILEDIFYIPCTVEDVSYSEGSMSTKMRCKLYLSAAFDRRIAQEQKFPESSLTPTIIGQTAPASTLTSGGYSQTRTGDGGGDRQNDILYEPKRYEAMPNQQVYSPFGRDRI